jgi:hypothetical protein
MKSQSVLGIAVAFAMFSAATSARAQDDAGQARQTAVEITPYLFLGSGTSTGVGAAARWPLASRLSVELETAYRRAEISALSFNLSLLYDLPRVGAVTPYLAGGIGLDQYGTAEFLAGKVVARERTALSVNAGGGLRVKADENWGIRTDARWFNDIGTGPERWRLYNGVTFGRAKR